MTGRRLRIALIGDDDEGSDWASALRAEADVVAMPEELTGGIDAVVLAAGTHDPYARAKGALEAGVPVLYAAPFMLSPWQAARLSLLAGRKRRLLRFVEPFQYRTGFPFLRRLVEGREPFWRPRYLRLLCLASPQDGVRIDELATEELAACDALLDDEPRRVSAAVVRQGDLGEICAVFLTLQYEGGAVVQSTVSLTEADSGRQLVATAAGRTIVLDDLGPVASVRVAGRGNASVAEGPVSGERVHQMLAGNAIDLAKEEVSRFIEAVTKGDLGFGNGRRWTRVAATWWAARQSMSFDEPMDVPSALAQLRDTEPPPLKVIEGGGKRARTTGARPALTVVTR